MANIDPMIAELAIQDFISLFLDTAKQAKQVDEESLDGVGKLLNVCKTTYIASLHVSNIMGMDVSEFWKHQENESGESN